MRIALLSIALALLAVVAVRQEFSKPSPLEPPPQAAARPEPAVAPPAPAATVDLAAAEVTESEEPLDPCDLSGYDMTKMTVDLHEQLVRACERSKN